eukprot:scaffold10626_cov112-Cylindrotheca_fusiformis.AAC.7
MTQADNKGAIYIANWQQRKKRTKQFAIRRVRYNATHQKTSTTQKEGRGQGYVHLSIPLALPFLQQLHPYRIQVVVDAITATRAISRSIETDLYSK